MTERKKGATPEMTERKEGAAPEMTEKKGAALEMTVSYVIFKVLGVQKFLLFDICML